MDRSRLRQRKWWPERESVAAGTGAVIEEMSVTCIATRPKSPVDIILADFDLALDTALTEPPYNEFTLCWSSMPADLNSESALVPAQKSF